jgi:hypothetical protein
MSAVSPLMAALPDVDCKARVLMRVAGNTRQREQLRDALDELRGSVLDVVAHNAARGMVDLDLDTFRGIVERAAELGLSWTDMAGTFNQVRERRPT